MCIYYTIYETTCCITGTKYRGAHTTLNPFDDYLGSGLLIKRSISKYGRSNFTKEIIFYAFSERDMYEIESLLVNEEWISQTSNYNLKVGGLGGSLGHTDETKQRISNTMSGKPKPSDFGSKVSATKHLHPKAARPKGTINTKDHNQKISESKKGKPSHMSTCPHCGKTGGTGAMSRHHFDHCKSRE